jgi:hypothetical protein
MGLDLWFRQDVARILAATCETMQVTHKETRGEVVTERDEEIARAYMKGFEDALKSVSIAFGLTEGGSLRAEDGYLKKPKEWHERDF